MLAGCWIRVKLLCECMQSPMRWPERSWHREEVEVLTDEEARELIQNHQCEGSTEIGK